MTPPAPVSSSSPQRATGSQADEHAGRSQGASPTSMAVVDDGRPYELFEVLEIAGDVARVRTPFMFEIGEDLQVRVEAGTERYTARATVRAHLDGPSDSRVTELELTDKTPVSG